MGALSRDWHLNQYIARNLALESFLLYSIGFGRILECQVAKEPQEIEDPNNGAWA